MGNYPSADIIYGFSCGGSQDPFPVTRKPTKPNTLSLSGKRSITSVSERSIPVGAVPVTTQKLIRSYWKLDVSWTLTVTLKTLESLLPSLLPTCMVIGIRKPLLTRHTLLNPQKLFPSGTRSCKSFARLWESNFKNLNG